MKASTWSTHVAIGLITVIGVFVLAAAGVILAAVLAIPAERGLLFILAAAIVLQWLAFAVFSVTTRRRFERLEGPVARR